MSPAGRQASRPEEVTADGEVEAKPSEERARLSGDGAGSGDFERGGELAEGYSPKAKKFFMTQCVIDLTPPALPLSRPGVIP